MSCKHLSKERGYFLGDLTMFVKRDSNIWLDSKPIHNSSVSPWFHWSKYLKLHLLSSRTYCCTRSLTLSLICHFEKCSEAISRFFLSLFLTMLFYQNNSISGKNILGMWRFCEKKAVKTFVMCRDLSKFVLPFSKKNKNGQSCEEGENGRFEWHENLHSPSSTRKNSTTNIGR